MARIDDSCSRLKGIRAEAEEAVRDDQIVGVSGCGFGGQSLEPSDSVSSPCAPTRSLRIGIDGSEAQVRACAKESGIPARVCGDADEQDGLDTRVSVDGREDDPLENTARIARQPPGPRLQTTVYGTESP